MPDFAKLYGPDNGLTLEEYDLQQTCDGIFERSEFFDLLDDYDEKTEEGWVYSLIDGTSVLVKWDGSIVHCKDM